MLPFEGMVRLDKCTDRATHNKWAKTNSATEREDAAGVLSTAMAFDLGMIDIYIVEAYTSSSNCF